MVYMVSLADGHLLLGGRMTVKRIVSWDQAVKILHTDDLHEADEHIIGEESDGTPLNLHRRLASALSRQLLFVSPNSNPKGLRFVSDTHLDVQATRAFRELTPESAALLDRIIEVTDRLPRSDQLITVTEELLRNAEAQEGTGQRSTNVWWCNQSDQWNVERPEEVVCSSDSSRHGGNNLYRKTVGEAKRVDLVVHYRKPHVVAFSRA